METRGTRIDRGYLEALKLTLDAQLEPIRAAIHLELGDINLNSPKQVLQAIQVKYGVTPLNYQKKPSVDKLALSKFAHLPACKKLLEFSEVDTLLSSFVRPYLARGEEYVHPFFNQCGTRTGRPSCANPNLLQIPRRTENGKLVRAMFIPREGMDMGDADFGQIEPRIMAHVFSNKAMLDMFNSGIKFHRFTQEKMRFGGKLGEGPEYDRAKVLNLSVGYRATNKSVSEQLKCSTTEAQTYIDKWWGAFPGLKDAQDRFLRDAEKTGYFTTLFGRRIKVDGLSDTHSFVERATGRRVFPRREAAERQTINNLCQGSAAEVMKIAMVKVDAIGVGLLAQVYDELLFEAPKDEAPNVLETVKDLMAHSVKLSVPLTVDGGVGCNWSAAKG